MSTFISLADAARQLAGTEAGGDDALEFWIALLTEQADQLQAVKSWVIGRSNLPGGVSYAPSPVDWRIPQYAFNAWCRARGIPLQSSVISEAPTMTGTPMSAETQAAPAAPQQRQAWQEAEILRVIASLGLSAMALPKPKPGKSGAKAEVRQSLKLPVKVFDLAWERLRADGRIADAAPLN